MADNSAVSTTQAVADYIQHLDTYHLFVGLAKWGIIVCLVILVGMAIFLL